MKKALLLLLLFVCSSVGAVDMVTTLSIPYATHDGFDQNLTSLDIYAPVDDGEYPVMIYVHGGGWWTGDKAAVHVKEDYFVGNGWVFVSLNYRLTPDVEFPTHAEDVAEGIAWTFQNIGGYKGDSRRIHLMGHSAGCHLAALVATDEHYLWKHGIRLRDINGVIANDSAAYDLVGMAERQGGALHDIFADTFGQDPEMWAFASPVTHVSPGKGIPPFISVYSAGDDPANVNPVRELIARDMTARLNKAGVMSDVTGDLTMTHGDVNHQFGLTNGITQDSEAFLKKLTRFTRMQFRKDLDIGSTDNNGAYLGGTETLYLTPHNGMLFAATGYWNEELDPAPNTQILVKRSPEGPWEEDYEFLATGRVHCLKEITFTTDVSGNTLDPPVTLLCAAPGYTAFNRATVWWRNDPAETWVRTEVASGITDVTKAYVRIIDDHIDSVTGIHHIFAGVATSALYRGSYDPSAPLKIVWEPVPEITGTNRIHASAGVNGSFYISIGSTNDPADGEGGIFRRVDSATPSWEFVYEWPLENTRPPGMRGITAVDDPDNPGTTVLVGAQENRGVIERVDPATGTPTIEFDVRDHFTTIWESLGGAASLAAYNDMLPVTDPISGKEQHLLSLFINHPDIATAPYNGAYYLVRHADGGYAWGNIYDHSSPVPDGSYLRSVRTWAPSPFSEEAGRVYYCGGFDGAGGPWHETAWIYKAYLHNAMPTANSQSVSVDEDDSVLITLAGSDADSDPVTFEIQDQPTHGSLSAIDGNQVTYAPDPDYAGPDSFTFITRDMLDPSLAATVDITVTPINDDPVITAGPSADPASITLPDTVNLSVTATDVEGDPLSFVWSKDSGPGNVDFSVQDSNTVASFDAAGSYTLRVTVTDGNSGSTSATVDATVNDPPGVEPQISLTGGSDFGSTYVDDGTVERSFTIANTGNGTLELTGGPVIHITGSDAAEFSVSVEPATSIAPEGSTTFSITFDPASEGNKTATLSIDSNDPVTPTVTLDLSGEALAGSAPATPPGDDGDGGCGIAPGLSLFSWLPMLLVLLAVRTKRTKSNTETGIP